MHGAGTHDGTAADGPASESTPVPDGTELTTDGAPPFDSTDGAEAPDAIGTSDAAIPPSCPAAADAGTAFDPRHYAYADNTIEVGYEFQPDMSVPLPGYYSRVVMPTVGSAVPPDDMAGNCVYHALALTGSAARNAAPTLNAGMIRATQGTQLISLTYDPVMMAYLDDESMGEGIMFEMPVTFDVAGGHDIAAMRQMITMPPRADDTTFAGPASISLSNPNVFTWTTPIDTSGDLAVALILQDSTDARVIVCVAPACAGSLTVPPTIVARHYAVGVALFQETAYVRRVVAMAGTRNVDFRLAARVSTTPSTVM
jgi:hypothetical protein